MCNAASVPLEVVPLTDEYWDRVVSHSLAEARAGRTPNPDVWCNSRCMLAATALLLRDTVSRNALRGRPCFATAGVCDPCAASVNLSLCSACPLHHAISSAAGSSLAPSTSTWTGIMGTDSIAWPPATTRA